MAYRQILSTRCIVKLAVDLCKRSGHDPICEEHLDSLERSLRVQKKEILPQPEHLERSAVAAPAPALLAALKLRGINAYLAHAPYIVSVPLPGDLGDVFVTAGHNWDGWEAVVENRAGTWTSLPDGPEPEAGPSTVAGWVARVIPSEAR